MNKTLTMILAGVTLVLPARLSAQETYTNDFSDNGAKLATVGRGSCSIADGVLRSRGSYAKFGNPQWRNYEMAFRARAPKNAEQVQIWAGFRTHNRFDRYVVGIKGGLQDDLYLMRSGYMGTDEFMGVRPLGFHPVPGEWYKLRIQVVEGRIRVFVGDNKKPHIDIVDKNVALVPTGEVSLGGGWIDTEFDDLTVKPLAEDALKDVKRNELNFRMTAAQKEEKRKKERATYVAKRIEKLNTAGNRTELSLDGDWLFMPEYDMKDKARAISADTDDMDWHVMQVPNFWTPIRIWLHGETMPAAVGQEHKGVSDTYYQRETDRCENYTFNYRRTDAAWYRQWIELPKEVKGKKMVLNFDAVSKVAEVYINGQLAATHIGMFGEFQVDATKLMKPGKNLLAVKVIRKINGAEAQNSEAMENYYGSVRRDVNDNKDDQQANKAVLTDVPNGFYGDNPAGIWQPVKLVVSDPLKIEDVFIQPALDGAKFDITVKNASTKKRTFNIYADIVDKKTGETLYSGELAVKKQLKNGEETLYTAEVKGLQPKLWEPATPNLYDFKFRIMEGKKLADEKDITSGFRTFEARPDGFFYLNGRRFWLRGGNHIPFAICPNDAELADRFMQLMKEGNVNSTRTHTSPWNELWMTKADENGIGVSFEGTKSWLMIHSTPIPDRGYLDLWRTEWLTVMKKFRNHPSCFFWTVNNEMKFYDLDADKERAAKKMHIISDAVKEMRRVDPTRPISFDSNYMRRNGVNRFGAEFMKTIDDGDIDDNHAYYNWYDFSVFRFFNGEFQRNFKTPGRPLISQEMSTGYPNAETGHPTRSYQLIHQNPYTLCGYEAYDWADPANFLKVQAFITGELGETLRRTGSECSGIMHFSYMTWLRQHYDAKRISPYPAWYAMQRAMQPVLVSAELWGRNLYAGEHLSTRIYVVNNDDNGKDLPATQLTWAITDDKNRVLATGTEQMPAVEYYGRKYIEPTIIIPTNLPADKVYGKLRLSLKNNGTEISRNEYDLTLARREWNMNKVAVGTRIAILDGDGMTPKLSALGIKATMVTSVKELFNRRLKADVRIVSGLTSCTDAEAAELRAYYTAGGRLVFLNSKEVAKKVFPEYIKDWIIPTEGDIVVMERDDAPVFDGIGVLDLRYFNNNRREIPLACTATLKVSRCEAVTELAAQMKIHAYIDGGKPEDRIKRIESMRGLTLFQIAEGKGKAIVSTMCTEKALTDPIAGHLLVNIINETVK